MAIVSERAFGVTSMTAELRRALLSRPAPDADFAAAGWRASPNAAKLLAEHDAFASLLAGLGVDITVLPAADGLPDACFAYDPVFVTGAGAITLRMAKAVRSGEPERLAAALELLGVPTAGALHGDAVADGGDMFWLDETTLAVARSYRTNSEAHRQLAELLAAEGVSLERFDLPHHHGRERVMHLLSVVSPVAPDLAVVFEPLAPVPLLEALDERGIGRIAAAADELESQGCNVLAISQGVVVVAEGNPQTRRALERARCEVHAYRAEELNKGEGGPTCLTRPILRGEP